MKFPKALTISAALAITAFVGPAARAQASMGHSKMGAMPPAATPVAEMREGQVKDSALLDKAEAGAKVRFQAAGADGKFFVIELELVK